MWSLGVIAYELLALHRPFSGASMSELMTNVLAFNLSSPAEEDLDASGHPAYLTSLVATDALLNLNPDERTSLLQLQLHLETGRAQHAGASSSSTGGALLLAASQKAPERAALLPKPPPPPRRAMGLCSSCPAALPNESVQPTATPYINADHDDAGSTGSSEAGEELAGPNEVDGKAGAA